MTDAEIRGLAVRAAEAEQKSNAAVITVRKTVGNELDKMAIYIANGGNDPAVLLRLIERAKSRLG